MANDRDSEQDEMIRKNAERITRNEEAIRRQTEALEKIRDHYYPKKTMWKSVVKFFAKVSCAIFAYLGIAETVDWIWNAREADALAEKYAAAAQRLFYSEGDARGALTCYEKAFEIDPKESEYVMALTYMKGLALASELLVAERQLTAEEHARVATALSEAIVLKELQPDKPMPYVLMAQAFLLSGEKDDAVASVEQAVACDAENASVRVSGCAINFFAGRPTEARAHLAEAERLNPALPLVSAWKGVLALAVDHDAATARTCFRGLARKYPRLPSAHVFLGKALLAGKDPDIKGARESFKRALVLDSKLMTALLGVAETYEREGNLLVARLWYDRALEIDARSTKAFLARARVNEALGEWRLAEQDLTSALQIDAFNAELYRARAKIREKCGMKAEAAADLKTAEALNMV